MQDGRSGRTVLHYAVESGDLDAVRFVAINCQANVNATTFDGSTPLKLAVGRGFHAAANLLVQAGADRTVLNSDDSDSSDSDDELGADAEVSNQQIWVHLNETISFVRREKEDILSSKKIPKLHLAIVFSNVLDFLFLRH